MWQFKQAVEIIKRILMTFFVFPLATAKLQLYAQHQLPIW